MKRIFCLLFIFYSTFTFCQKNSLPEPYGLINDFENIFSEEESLELNKIIIDFENKTSNEIAIASLNDIQDYTDFDSYTLDLSNFWGVGKKYLDNGLTIFFSTSLRKIRINTGKQTQLILTDEKCQKVLDEIILPEFKKNNYFIGIKKPRNLRGFSFNLFYD